MVGVENAELPGVSSSETSDLGHQVAVPATIALVVLTAVSTGVGYFVLHGLGGSIVDFDLEVARDLVEGRTPGMNSLTAATTFLADSVPVAIAWVAAMAIARWRTGEWRISAFIMAAIGGEKLTYLVTSMLVGRDRPPGPVLGKVHAANSFPSGHVGAAIVLYGGIVVAVLWWDAAKRGHGRSRTLHVALGMGVAAITALVAYSRLYRSFHFPSDVVWGAVLGVVWLALAWRIALRGQAPKTSPNSSGTTVSS